MSKSWREYATPIIAEVLKTTKGQTDKEIRKALKDAYPFGERKYWPYKVWCDEIRRQTGVKSHKQEIQPENQTSLFNG